MTLGRTFVGLRDVPLVPVEDGQMVMRPLDLGEADSLKLIAQGMRGGVLLVMTATESPTGKNASRPSSDAERGSGTKPVTVQWDLARSDAAAQRTR